MGVLGVYPPAPPGPLPTIYPRFNVWNDSGRSSWGPLKGDIARAEADARRSAELDAQIARQKNVDDRGFARCSECHQQMPSRYDKVLTTCKRCTNKLNERKRRERARAKLAAKGIAA